MAVICSCAMGLLMKCHQLLLNLITFGLHVCLDVTNPVSTRDLTDSLRGHKKGNTSSSGLNDWQISTEIKGVTCHILW